MSEINIHGLTRTIPSDIKRKIRQRTGFGCIVCGLGIFQYEHIKPEFSEAKEHDPDKMTTLCGSCHDKVTRKIWSKNKIIRHNQAPKCRELGYSRDFFDIGDNIPISN